MRRNYLSRTQYFMISFCFRGALVPFRIQTHILRHSDFWSDSHKNLVVYEWKFDFVTVVTYGLLCKSSV